LWFLSSQNVLAVCEPEYWESIGIGADHYISFESLPLEVDLNEVFTFSVHVVDIDGIANQSGYPGWDVKINFGDGTIPIPKRINTWYGSVLTFIPECTATIGPLHSPVSFDCVFPQSLSYSSGGQKTITVDIYDQLGPYYHFCNETTINVIDSCGNGVIDTDNNEECDGDSSITQTCQDYGSDSGSLKCTSDCKIDTSDCFATAPLVLPTEYPNPLIWQYVVDFLEYFLLYVFRIGSGIAVLVILIGAFMMVTSAGDPRRADKGKKTVIWALIGFAVTMTANGIIALLREFLGVTK
jgi:hypothetical protein